MTEKVIISLALLVILLVIALVSCDATARADGVLPYCADVEGPCMTVEGLIALACIVGLLCYYIVGRVRNRR